MTKFQDELLEAIERYAELYGTIATHTEKEAYKRVEKLVERAVDGGCKNPNCDIRQRHEHRFSNISSIEDIFLYE